ncbi:hypothetical protein FH972_022801 [Carpinus fangiana]|uniref:Mediator of RNA polymerase II transcription subunit 14 n=1 Tax=Carpinus fangiana TaxID=176857 RepID=A0A5N6KTU7_9ROSI|nr:hypothetical protein FH972_022801 [Carpinus fangiana]
MPGRLMDHHGRPDAEADDARQFKRQRTEAAPPPQPPQPMPNGLASEPAAPRAGGNPVKGAPREEPPDIEHITEGFYPLSALYQRISQECATDFGDLLDNMPHAAPQTNGVSASQHLQPLTSIDAQRRRLWMEFSRKHRDRFTKLLVLTRAGAQATEASRLIDVGNWLHFQTMHYETTLWRLADIKRFMSRFKIPAPDIETAVDVLSKGSVSRAPDLGYLPPAPLTPANLLKSLRNINTILHIRLTKDEDLPPYLRSYRVHSGRVTFTAPGEFELDVSVADEDPASQFYLIDLRLLFSPNTDIPASLLHGILEPRANGVLAKEGLTGCFQLLRDFVLTHKINILRRQAVQLNGKAWAGALRVEPAHRSLVVQYWKERPGGKSWIEIGVQSGVTAGRQADESDDQHPRLGYRLFRAGKEVKHLKLDLEPAELDFERILKCVIAQHTSDILSKISTSVASSHSVLRESVADPRACSLELPYSSPYGARSMTVLLEALSGKFVLQPWSQNATRYEDAINKLRDPGNEAAPQIQRFQGSEIQRETDAFVERGGLTVAQDVNSRNMFPSALRVRFFKLPGRPYGTWLVGWLLSPDRQSIWKAIELDLQPSGIHNVRRSIDLDEQDPPTASALAHAVVNKIHKQLIEDQLNAAGARYSFSADGGELSVKVERSSLLSNTRHSQSLWASDDIVIAVPAASNARNTANSRGQGITSHIIYGQMRLGQNMREALKGAKSFNDEFHEDGRFGLLLGHELGSTTVISDAVARLLALQRLCALVGTLCSANLKPQRADSQQVDFSYSTEQPELKALITFKADRLSLELEPATNPHNRILHFLRAQLNAAAAPVDPTPRFESFLTLLQSTLPILRALHAVETEDKGANAVVHTRDVRHFRLAYSSLSLGLDIRMRERRGRHYWTISYADEHIAAGGVEVEKALAKLFEGKGPNWFGVKSGIVAEGEGDSQAVSSTSSSEVSAALVLESLIHEVVSTIRSSLLAPSTGSEQNGAGKGAKPNQAPGTGPGIAASQRPAQPGQQGLTKKEKLKPGKIELPQNPVQAATNGKPPTIKQEVIMLD